MGPPARVEDRREQTIIRKVQQMRAKGMTLSAISTKLAGQGFKNRDGRQLSVTTLTRILKRYPPPD